MNAEHDSLIYGANTDEGLVAVEHVATAAGGEMVLFFRRGDETAREREPFEPFIVADLHAIADCPVEYKARELAGRGRLNLHATFASWKDCLKARGWLGKSTGFSAARPRMR